MEEQKRVGKHVYVVRIKVDSIKMRVEEETEIKVVYVRGQKKQPSKPLTLRPDAGQDQEQKVGFTIEFTSEMDCNEDGSRKPKMSKIRIVDNKQ